MTNTTSLELGVTKTLLEGRGMTDEEKDNSLRRRMKIAREREQYWNDKWYALLRQRVELDYTPIRNWNINEEEENET